jgi:hypothetical protein
MVAKFNKYVSTMAEEDYRAREASEVPRRALRTISSGLGVLNVKVSLRGALLTVIPMVIL